MNKTRFFWIFLFIIGVTNLLQLIDFVRLPFWLVTVMNVLLSIVMLVWLIRRENANQKTAERKHILHCLRCIYESREFKMKIEKNIENKKEYLPLLTLADDPRFIKDYLKIC